MNSKGIKPQVKIISETFEKDLAFDVNKFINDGQYLEIKEIQFAQSSECGVTYYTAYIIYYPLKTLDNDSAV